ncbi:hypothetical protein OO17_00745 [Rhodopseudomonas palustris]|uniref:Uncharacterized protein n=1 Tax=Rhodopseudomonas palustris TaxID=1076 RepID=A0A0D7F8P8_RHOPL|nr:hypothetical protein OO17_00745 [Rhodopseudomonas palustris]
MLDIACLGMCDRRWNSSSLRARQRLPLAAERSGCCVWEFSPRSPEGFYGNLFVAMPRGILKSRSISGMEVVTSMSMRSGGEIWMWRFYPAKAVLLIVKSLRFGKSVYTSHLLRDMNWLTDGSSTGLTCEASAL